MVVSELQVGTVLPEAALEAEDSRPAPSSTAVIVPTEKTQVNLVVSREVADANNELNDLPVSPNGWPGRYSLTRRDGKVIRYRRSWSVSERLFEVNVSENGVMVIGHSGTMNDAALGQLINCLAAARLQLAECIQPKPKPAFESEFPG